MKFFFTYGTEGQPFSGGWTEIEAPDYEAACTVFRVYHPDKKPPCLNCAGVYEEARFVNTTMHISGNYGKRCHERLFLVRQVMTTQQEDAV